MDTIPEPTILLKLAASNGLIEIAREHLNARLAAKYGSPLVIRETKKGRTVKLNSMMIAAILAEEMLLAYDPSLSIFYSYNEREGTWTGVTEAILKYRFDDLIRKIAILLGVSKDELVPLCEDRKLSSLVSIIKGRVESPDIFEKKRAAVHVGNGMLLWEKGGFTLTEYHPIYYSRNRCAINFEPDAECPEFMEFLTWAVPDPEDRSTLQLLMGQWLLGVNLMQKIVVFRGKAGSGKSTLMAIFREIVGRQNTCELRTAHLNERFEINNYFRKSLLLGSDVKEDFLCNGGADALKKLTGDDVITLEAKYAAKVREILGNFNIGITTNNYLRIGLGSDADAWKRRLFIVDFLSRLYGKNRIGYATALVKIEGKGILRWMVEGAAQLFIHIDRQEELPMSLNQIARVNEVIGENESLTQFIAEKVIPGAGDITTSEIVEAYQQYCSEKNWKPLLNPDRYIKQLISQNHNINQRHDINRNGNDVRGYNNLTLK